VRRSSSSRSGSAKVPALRPPTFVWYFVALVGFAGLLLVAWMYSSHAPHSDVGFIDGLFEVAGRTAVSATLAAATGLLMLWGWRNVALAVLARGGAVHVPEFSGASESQLPVLSATLRFREQLASLHLESELSTQPGAADTADFASIVGSVSLDPKQMVTTVVNLIRAAIPTHAYEVKASLVTRDNDPKCCGVAVQVVRRPKTVSAMRTCWAPTFPAAVDLAANEAAAFILPRTNRCRNAPWRTWRGYVVPPALLDAYERASARVSARRYDEALALFDTALKLDPLNLDIRLRIGLVQEQLGLYVDALDTYMAMYEIVGAAEGTFLGRPKRRVTRARTDALNVALYREAILFGGESLSAQWRRAAKVNPPARRDQERVVLRGRLRPFLVGRLERLSQQGADPVSGLLEEPRRGEAEEVRREKELELRWAFQELALRDLTRLKWRLRRRLRPFPTRAAVATSTACVQLRLMQTRLALGKQVPADEKHRSVDDRAKHALRGWWLLRQGGSKWDAQYNIACLYAIGLNSDRGADDNARKAVAQLKRAVARVDSGFVAGRASWLLREDPDLTALRSTPAFREFESQFFLYDRREQASPDDRHMAAVDAHTRNLQAQFAARREQLWHDRAAGKADTPLHQVCAWWKTECESWSQISRLAVDYRHWPMRWEVINSCNIGTAEEGLEAIDIAYPTPERLEQSRELIVRQIKLLNNVDTVLLGRHLGGVEARLRRLDLDGVTTAPGSLTQLCSCQAALWQLVHLWLTEPTLKGCRTHTVPERTAEDERVARAFRSEVQQVLARYGRRRRIDAIRAVVGDTHHNGMRAGHLTRPSRSASGDV
jgi:hypothetical protein